MNKLTDEKDKKMKTNFIKTSAPNVAEELKANGFTLVSKEGEMYVFLNDGKANFSDESKNQVIFTDILHI